MMEPRLPLDILTIIPDYINEGEDLGSLKALCLTSSLFLQPCQTHLLNHITLSTEVSPSQVQTLPGEELLNLLEHSPRLTKYIKRLTISDYFHPEWLPIDTALSGGFEQAIHQPDQSRSGSPAGAQPTPWEELPPDTQSSLIQLCRSTSLEDLTIHNAPMTAFEYGVGQEIFLTGMRLYGEHNFDKGVEYLLNDANKIRLDKLRTNTILHGSLRTFVFRPSVFISSLVSISFH
ncbi:hypothetical protein DFP72DRAFT_901460 [Ephemerocybe angulata]|uniref:Uncharacterized protein n=1 Tax=Ephemerocybe angulata TaxID=980116 RepID=A0A8H6M6C3_9AGAR|nr:hypothetical protein DFP72DRAFT_901460 [Tulosesus angulatus]